ncbi:hypothetical protein AVEN_177280-1 [Araneus ventricosus]|uniref:Uncharacterized protein n=1 Tax=Araneus ventricosus TaxID=182803 RepID=A0A4Y2W4Y1_ARAVE|nr:hypothetical protein AVEN_177280-1 [Araneus ventricosus]
MRASNRLSGYFRPVGTDRALPASRLWSTLPAGVHPKRSEDDIQAESSPFAFTKLDGYYLMERHERVVLLMDRGYSSFIAVTHVLNKLQEEKFSMIGESRDIFLIYRHHEKISFR